MQVFLSLAHARAGLDLLQLTFPEEEDMIRN